MRNYTPAEKTVCEWP